jgi:hypothetical protein
MLKRNVISCIYGVENNHAFLKCAPFTPPTKHFCIIYPFMHAPNVIGTRHLGNKDTFTRIPSSTAKLSTFRIVGVVVLYLAYSLLGN